MKSKSEALKIKNTPAPPDTSGAHCLGSGNVWVWGLDALQPAPGDSEGVPAGVSPPFRLGIAFSTDAGGSLGDPRVPARSHRVFFWGGGAGGDDGDTRRGKKNPIYRGKILSRSLFRRWRGSGLCPPLVRAAPFPAFCGFQHYLLSNFWRPSGDFWPRDGWLRPLGRGHGQVQPLRSHGHPPSPPKKYE